MIDLNYKLIIAFSRPIPMLEKYIYIKTIS